jgi:hypothetical protein
MSIHDKYTPRSLTGYTFWSNYFEREEKTGYTYTREFVMNHVANYFDIPVTDVWVEPFTPDKDYDWSFVESLGITPNPTTWAAFVKNKHAVRVNAFCHELDTLIKELKKYKD